MTAVDVTVDRFDELEAKIDLLTDRVLFLTEQAEEQARRRAMYEELVAEMSGLSGQAMAFATRELETITLTADLGDTVRLLRRFLEVAPVLERALVVVSQLSDLVADFTPLTGDVMAAATEALAEADDRGYFEFVKAVMGVAEQVMTNFSADDVDLLGDNVVTILEAVREITQPELLALVARMVGAVKTEQAIVELEAGDPPGMWSLLKQLRDPEVRRGMARALETLRAVSVTTGPGRPTD
jgi:hypothetical protein